VPDLNHDAASQKPHRSANGEYCADEVIELASANDRCWHVASFRCGAKVRTLLEVKRTFRARRECVNLTEQSLRLRRSTGIPALPTVKTACSQCDIVPH